MISVMVTAPSSFLSAPGQFATGCCSRLMFTITMSSLTATWPSPLQSPVQTGAPATFTLALGTTKIGRAHHSTHISPLPPHDALPILMFTITMSSLTAPWPSPLQSPVQTGAPATFTLALVTTPWLTLASDLHGGVCGPQV